MKLSQLNELTGDTCNTRQLLNRVIMHLLQREGKHEKKETSRQKEFCYISAVSCNVSNNHGREWLIS